MNRIYRGRWVFTGASTLVLALSLVFSLGAEAKTGPPTVTEIKAIGVHSTRAQITSDMCANGSLTEYTIEIAEDNGGEPEWKSVGKGMIEPASPTNLNGCGAASEAEFLQPETKYDIRIIGENAAGNAIEKGQFETHPVEPAEILRFQVPSLADFGPEFVAPTLEVEDNGAASTSYLVDVSTCSEPEKCGPYEEVANGTVSKAEDHVRRRVEIKGLSPSTLYSVRLMATNGVGSEASRVFEVTTRPVTPLVSCCSVGSVGGTSVHLTGQVNPDDSSTKWQLQVASSSTAADSEWRTVSEGVIEADTQDHQVEGDAGGLTEEKTFYARVVAENTHPPRVVSEVRSFETSGRPAVSVLAMHAIHLEMVSALALVVAHGSDTHVLAEYIDLGQWETTGWSGALSGPEEDVGAGEYQEGRGFPSKTVGVDLPGVELGHSYRLRLVASSMQGTATSTEQTLSLPAPEIFGSVVCGNEASRLGPSAALADCRAYEQVTPFDKAGAMDIFKYGAITAGENAGLDGDHFMLHVPGVRWGSNSDPKQSDYFFTRESKGWGMRSVRPVGEVGPTSYSSELFDENLTRVGVEAGWSTSEESLSASVEFKDGPPGGPYQLLGRGVTRSKIGEMGGIVAASQDFSKTILQLEDHTFAGHSSGTTEGDDLYEVEGATVRQVNVAPGGGVLCTSGARIVSGQETVTSWGGKHVSSPHSVSADGSKVFFTDMCAHRLYMRVDGTETVEIGTYAFVAADATGERVLLERTTGETHEFFVYDTASLSVSALPGLVVSAPIEKLVVSDDFTAVYFNTHAVLTPEAAPSEQLNIYRYDLSAKSLRFVADGGSGEESVSPDGRFLYFGAGQSGGDHVDGLPGKNQVYRFDNTVGEVECMSCASAFDREPKLKATFFGEPTIAKGTNGIPTAFMSSADGRFAFFDTPSALVPQDINGERAVEGTTVEGGGIGEFPSNSFSPSSDVYEWRGDGVDGCVLVGGCLSLISGGQVGYMVQFLGTTPSGNSVFFSTHESLVSGDNDTAGDVYDARVGGGFPPQPPPPIECEGDACTSPVAAPIDVTPASFAFIGPENPVAKSKPAIVRAKRCHKGFVRKKGKCVRKARKRKKSSRGVHGGPRASHRVRIGGVR